MKDNFESISAIWQDGQKSVAECAELIYDFLILLNKHNSDLFSELYKKGYTKENASNRVELSQEYLYKIVEKKWDKKFPHLGCRISFWNGMEDDDTTADISFSLGAYGDKPHIKSVCVLSLPNKGKQFEFYKEKSNQNSLIKLMKGYWHPKKILVNGDLMEEIT